MRPFSIPKADRWAAATARRLVLPGARAAFSIPKADRWAAARNPAPGAPAPGRPLSVSPKRIDGLQLGRAALLAQLAQPLSVSPKRIDGLQHIDEIRAYVEQYAPFSIPKADRWAAASGAGPRPSLRASSFSIPKADRWAAAQPGVPARHSPAEAFSIPKADRWAAAARSTH